MNGSTQRGGQASPSEAPKPEKVDAIPGSLQPTLAGMRDEHIRRCKAAYAKALYRLRDDYIEDFAQLLDEERAKLGLGPGTLSKSLGLR